MVQCLVGLGSNLGESRLILDQAVEFLSNKTSLIAASRWYAYPSIGPSADQLPQPDFINGTVLLDSSFSAKTTANLLHDMERKAGRDRTIRWSSRTLDADLLIFGDEIVRSENLIVPHPRMMSRRFVLEPACEIAGDLIHPTMGWTMQRLFDHLLHAQPLFAILGNDAKASSDLAKRLAKATGGDSYSLEHQRTSSSEDSDTINYAAEAMGKISDSIRLGKRGPWFANFWAERAVAKSKDFSGLPKLILVLDAPDSALAVRIARSMELRPELRVPVIHLSADEHEAWQDALGAVQGMQ